ncbi:hypothetical protein Tco_0814543 [Tanacetum coccineum]
MNDGVFVENMRGKLDVEKKAYEEHRGDISRPITIANGSSSNPSKSEIEEGRLSLYGDFDESNIGKRIEADGDDDDSENRVHDDNDVVEK